MMMKDISQLPGLPCTTPHHTFLYIHVYIFYPVSGLGNAHVFVMLFLSLNALYSGPLAFKTNEVIHMTSEGSLEASSTGGKQTSGEMSNSK